MSRFFDEDAYRFNEQFRESPEERAERWRKRRAVEPTDAEIERSQAKISTILGPDSEADKIADWISEGGSRDAIVSPSLLESIVHTLLQYKRDMTFGGLDLGQKQRRCEALERLMKSIRESKS